MHDVRFLCGILALVLALGVGGNAAAQQAQIKNFPISPIDTFDADENFVGQVDVSGVEPGDAEVVDHKLGMLKIQLKGEEYWVYDTDVILEGGKIVECQEVAQRSDAQTTATMGLGCQ